MIYVFKYILHFYVNSTYTNYFNTCKILQSHISENLNEIEAVRSTFPDWSSYAAVYDAVGLLTSKVC